MKDNKIYRRGYQKGSNVIFVVEPMMDELLLSEKAHIKISSRANACVRSSFLYQKCSVGEGEYLKMQNARKEDSMSAIFVSFIYFVKEQSGCQTFLLFVL
jgi:hypothetical protein